RASGFSNTHIGAPPRTTIYLFVFSVRLSPPTGWPIILLFGPHPDDLPGQEPVLRPDAARQHHGLGLFRRRRRIWYEAHASVQFGDRALQRAFVEQVIRGMY